MFKNIHVKARLVLMDLRCGRQAMFVFLPLLLLGLSPGSWQKRQKETERSGALLINIVLTHPSLPPVGPEPGGLLSVGSVGVPGGSPCFPVPAAGSALPGHLLHPRGPPRNLLYFWSPLFRAAANSRFYHIDKTHSFLGIW